MVFRKTGSPSAIATEAASLRWLAAAEDSGGAAVAELVSVGSDTLETRMLASGSPNPDQAREFGRRLAHTHAAGADFWGQAPPGVDPDDARLAELLAPMATEPRWDGFGEFYAEARLRPYLEDSGLRGEQRDLVERAVEGIAAGDFDSEQPKLVDGVARIHGDLWGGNVMWPGGVGTLIDPCAHGGHAETDLAELALFGTPHLEQIIAGYDEVSSLAPGWRERVGLHQLHMLLVHVVLFGGSYVSQTVAVARSLCR